jgi:hypothetical protein
MDALQGTFISLQPFTPDFFCVQYKLQTIYNLHYIQNNALNNFYFNFCTILLIKYYCIKINTDKMCFSKRKLYD